MELTRIARLTSVLGASAALMVFLLVGLAVFTGVSQEYFEGLHPVDEYTQRLVSAAPLLRVGFTFDNLFILAYGSFFIGLAIVLRQSANPSVVNLSLAALLSVALLDMIENHHILAMADAALVGIAPTDGEIRAQTVLSLVKFHLSCLGALLLAAGFPRDSALGRWNTWLLVGYAFFGVLVLTAPPHLLDLLALIRTLFFVVSFLVAARLMWVFADNDGRVN